jgi:bacteriorhodopsin
MDALTETWLWIAFAGMSLGAIIFAGKATAMRRREGMEFPLESLFITLWAAAMYLSMALGQTVTPFNDQLVFWGRYLDWIVTTPLLLLELGVLAGLRPKLIAGVMGADVFMIVTGAIATLSAAPVNFIWWFISTGAFLAILWSLLTEFSANAHRRNGKVNSLFSTLRNILIVLWFCYPIVWLLGPEGFYVIGASVETIIYAILDLCAKVGFGLILSFAGRDVLAQASNTSNIRETAHAYMESERRSYYR